MADTTFRTARTQSEITKTTQAPANVDKSSTAERTTDEVPVPYLDYKNTKKKPFTAEYFELGNFWDDKDGGFENELSIIEDYMYHLIGDGQLGNSTEAVREKIKALEKQAGIKKYDTTINRISKVAAFTKFLKETEKL